MKRIFTLISLIMVSTFLFGQAIVTTHVGTGIPGHITGQNSRTITPLDMPYGVVMDSKGNLWLSEEGGNDYGFVIKLVQPNGNTSVRVGTVGTDCFKNEGGINARFSQPRGLAVDANDNIYVADFGNCVIRRIEKFMSLGNVQWVSTFAGRYDSGSACYGTHPGYVNGPVKSAQFNGPCDIAFNKTKDTMYVADMENNCIRRITKGQVTTVAGHPDSMGFRDGTLANAKFNKPTGVFVASNGDIYVADHMNQRIRKISGGNVNTVLYDIQIVPDDVWLKANGDILFTSKFQICKYSGKTLTTIAGSFDPYEAGDADGVDTAARFNWVKGIVADNSNPIIFYVADQNNHKIKKLADCTAFTPPVLRYGGDNRGDTSYTCLGDSIYLEDSIAYSSYKWSTGQTTRKIFLTSSTDKVTCTVTTSEGCQGTSNDYYVRITPLVPRITPDGPTTFCPGGNVTLVGPPDYFTYKWTKNGITYDSGHNQSIKVATSGDYVLYGILGACNGKSSTVKVVVSSKIVPEIKVLKGDSILCSNDTLILESFGTFSTYKWTKNATQVGSSKSISITQAGDYTLSVTQTGGCSGASYPIHVVLIPAPTVPTFTVNKDSLTSSDAYSYQWYLNNQKIANATQKTYKAKQAGSYFVEVGSANGCKARSVAQQVTLSILELSNGLRFDVYPNPTNGKLIVSGTLKTSGNLNIRLVDMLGKSVYSNNTNIIPGNFEKQIDLQGNPPGIYFIIINSDGKQGVMKLILK